MVVASLVTVAVIGLGSLFRIASLRGGGDQVALQLGGTPVAEDTTDFNLRRLRNVVEEIAIASGVPVPRIYILEHEQAINAFAAGYSRSEEHTSELQSLMRISYAVFRVTKNKTYTTQNDHM